jgi:tRNA A37 N6-isopentenylltransferase MiaA
MISLTRDIQIANERIYTRVGEMLDMWLYDEVAGLYAQGYDVPIPSMMGIGYSQLLPMVKWEDIYTHAAAQASIGLASVQYAKRQRSRFRRYQKDALEHPVDHVTYMSFCMD